MSDAQNYIELLFRLRAALHRSELYAAFGRTMPAAERAGFLEFLRKAEADFREAWDRFTKTRSYDGMTLSEMALRAEGLLKEAIEGGEKPEIEGQGEEA